MTVNVCGSLLCPANLNTTLCGPTGNSTALLMGTGVVNLYYSFGWTGGDLNSNHALVGFSGIDNLSLLPDSNYAIPLVVIGGLCLIIANATAWKATDGY